MTYDEVMKLSPEELRIKCAELEGWDYVHKNVRNGISLWLGINPVDLCGSPLPDYSQPNDYMRLMGLIWEKDVHPYIRGRLVGGLPDMKQTITYGDYWENPQCRDLSEAIMRAYLIICGGE